MSAPRTWKERGEWMDKYGATIHDYSAHPHIRVSYTVNGRLCWRCSDWGAGAAVPIDRAMDECERLEREAEQAKRQQEAASRSPIAALNEEWEASNRQSQTAWYSHLKLDAAIKAQAARWRRAAQATRDVGGYGQFAEVLEKCANDLEGK